MISDATSKSGLERAVKVLTWSITLFILTILTVESNIVYWKFGAFSVSAYLTLVTPFFLGVSLVLLLFARRNSNHRRVSLPSARGTFWRAFLAVVSPWFGLSVAAMVSLLFHWRIEGLQNSLVLTSLVIGIVFFSIADPEITERTVNLFLPILGASLGVLFAITQMVDTELRFGVEIFSPRQFAMVAIVSLAAALSSSETGLAYRIAPYVILFSIIVSASRTATLAGGIMVLISIWNSSQSLIVFARRVLPFAAFGLISVVLGLLTTRDVAERFAGGGLEQTSVLSDSGRIQAWLRFLELPQTWWDWTVGLGAGASAEFGQRELVAFPQTLNEYLRFLLDNGVLGLLLFLATLIGIVVVTKTLGRRDAENNSAGLLVVGLALVAITDGPFYSYFVAMPASLVIGTGLSAGIRQLSSKREQLA